MIVYFTTVACCLGDVCYQHNCHEYAKCLPGYLWGYRCVCDDGYHGNGVTCKRKYYIQYRLILNIKMFINIIWNIVFRFSFTCQGTSTRRQRRDLFGLRVKLPPATTSLTTQWYRGNPVKSLTQGHNKRTIAGVSPY